MRDRTSGAGRRQRLHAARLYLCTPLRPDLADFLEAVLAGGVDIVQLRDKDATAEEQLASAPVFHTATRRHDALFIVNDDPDLALAAEADGVHVGQDDMPPAQARAIVGPDRLVGWSTHAESEVDAALGEDIDYFAVGPVSATPTKEGRPGIGVEPLRHAAATASMPWFVTGGMAVDTIPAILRTGATRIVVVRALTESPDPLHAAADLATALG